MEQDNLLSCTPQSSVSENREYVNYYHQIPSASSSTNYYHDPNYIREDYLPSLSSYQRAACSYPQTEYHSETNYSESPQASTSYESISYKDGGTAYEDEGTPYKDGGTPYEDEGTPYKDADTSYKDEVISYRDVGTLYRDEGASYTDKSASCRDEGASYGDEGASYEDEGTSYKDKGNAYEDEVTLYNDKGNAYEDESTAYKDEGTTHENQVTAYEGEGTYDNEGTAYEDEGEPYDDEECTCDSDDSSDSNESEDKEILGEIVEELFEEIIIEHCFRVHQAKKLGAFIFDEAVEETRQEQTSALMSTVTCPNCFNKHELKDYKVKLGECMGLTTRKSRRKTRAQPNFAETAIDSFPGHVQTKSKKRKQSKKGSSRSAKISLLQDDGDIYSKEACGHITKSGNKCTKKGNCPTHKPQPKHTMPVSDFGYRPSFQDEYDTIDVDTVEENKYPSFTSYGLSDYSGSEYTNSYVTRREENGKIKLVIKNDPQRRKKKKKLKHDHYPSPI